MKQITYNLYFLWFGTIVLSLLYFLRSTASRLIKKDDENENSVPNYVINFLEKMYWLGLAVVILGIPLKLRLEKNADNLLIIGLLFTALAVIIKLFYIKKIKFSWQDFVRFILLGLIGIFVLSF